jgi:hypothetical protein
MPTTAERQIAKYERNAAAASDEHIASVIERMTAARRTVDVLRCLAAYQTEADRRTSDPIAAASRRLGLTDRVCVQCGVEFESDQPYRLCDTCGQ